MGLFDWFRRKPRPTDRGGDADGDADGDGDDGDGDRDVDEGDLEDPFFDGDDVATPELTDELDLHTFQPRDCADLVAEYLVAAQEKGFASVRIIHGKGKGTLRRIVHSVLEKHPAVASFRLGDQRSGSWGATLVELRAPAMPSGNDARGQ